MIFFQIFIFVVSIVLLSFSISGYGKLINSKIKNNFFLDIFLGFIVISFIITTLHFFLNINLIISFSILTFGLILFFYKKNLYFSELLKKKNIFSLVVFFIFIPMFLSQKYHVAAVLCIILKDALRKVPVDLNISKTLCHFQYLISQALHQSIPKLCYSFHPN